jgi:hypothetical protein
MPTLQVNDKVSWVWNGLQYIWTFRKAISIVSLSLTLLYLLWAEVLEQRKYMRDQFEAGLSDLAKVEAAFAVAGNTAFREPSQIGSTVSLEAAEVLYLKAQDLRSELSSFPQANGRLDVLRDMYAGEVSDLIGSLNLIGTGGDAANKVLEEIHAVDLAATAYHEMADAYLASTWRTFWSAF